MKSGHFSVFSIGFACGTILMLFVSELDFRTRISRIKEEIISRNLGDYYIDEQKDKKFGWIVDGKFEKSESL